MFTRAAVKTVRACGIALAVVAALPALAWAALAALSTEIFLGAHEWEAEVDGKTLAVRSEWYAAPRVSTAPLRVRLRMRFDGLQPALEVRADLQAARAPWRVRGEVRVRNLQAVADALAREMFHHPRVRDVRVDSVTFSAPDVVSMRVGGTYQIVPGVDALRFPIDDGEIKTKVSLGNGKKIIAVFQFSGSVLRIFSERETSAFAIDVRELTELQSFRLRSLQLQNSRGGIHRAQFEARVSFAEVADAVRGAFK